MKDKPWFIFRRKKPAAVLFLCIFAVVLFGAGLAAGASSARPGSSGDPLITLSYLEERLAETAGDAYLRVLLTKGKRLSLGIGSEAVLYSGTGEAAGTGGLLDLTDGSLAAAGSPLVPYHLYLSLGEASGITASSTCILYVKGSYTRE